MNAKQDLTSFAKLLTALEPWLNQVVIIGGWAHRLYRMHPQAQPLEYLPLMTLDTDIALPPLLSIRGQDIFKRLRAQGFTEEFLGDDHPPATHYHLGGAKCPFYVEFLSPHEGSDYDRRGQRKTTLSIGGIVSQRLRNLEILLIHPWAVPFKLNNSSVRIQIANPVSFLAQKVLIHNRRNREDRAKDILYMRDTLEVFGAEFSSLRQLWKDEVSSKLSARNAGKISRASRDLFGVITDDIRRAARISPERALNPQAVLEACKYGFIKVFE